MGTQPHLDFSVLSVDELYLIYLAIAKRDHQWRVRALYRGEQPTGQCDVRPLGRDQFRQRYDKAQTFVGGELMLRQRLFRQASAYEIDVQAVLSDRQVV